jgi:maleate isomerase
MQARIAAVATARALTATAGEGGAPARGRRGRSPPLSDHRAKPYPQGGDVPDVLGYRAKMGVLGPSTNTIVEPDYYMMAPPGVTLHYSRIYIPDGRLGDDAEFVALMEQIRANLDQAIVEVLTAEPDYLIMGMSSETFWDGAEGNQRFTGHVEQLSGLRVATGAAACHRALQVLGARRLGVITPYQPVADAQVRRYFEETGYEILALEGLRCRSAVNIAAQGEDVLRAAIREVNRPGVDAVVQVGTNLSMVRLADAAERELGKPVVAINAATFWYALRDYGILDRRPGFGCLLREH